MSAPAASRPLDPLVDIPTLDPLDMTDLTRSQSLPSCRIAATSPRHCALEG